MTLNFLNRSKMVKNGVKWPKMTCDALRVKIATNSKNDELLLWENIPFKTAENIGKTQIIWKWHTAFKLTLDTNWATDSQSSAVLVRFLQFLRDYGWLQSPFENPDNQS